MIITEKIFQSFLRCETKSHLLSSGAIGTEREFVEWQDRQAEDYKQKCLVQLRAKFQGDEILICQGILEDLKKAKCYLAIGGVIQAEGLQTNIHALERLPPPDQKTRNAYFPIRFVPREKITSHDKLLLAFDALVISAASGRQPAFGKIIHGNEQKTVKVQLADLVKTAKAIVGKISAQRANASAPPLILNKHCAECEFKPRCRQIAVEKDELSLLSGLNEKERKKQHSKGIFTVTQLSYTYRPRRKPKRLAAKPDNYSHALRALAIRESKIHIAGSPKLNITGTPVYLDVEGVPDRDFYYLIGLRIKTGDSYAQHSFWANDTSEEKIIWAAFLHTLAQIENPQLVHYGSYETTFLKRMKERYGNPIEGAAILDQLIKDSVNVLSAIYAQIYFPTYSNSLKEIAPYLGFQWSESDASGLNSLLWRSEWEITKDCKRKQSLLTYNAEDCNALEKVAEVTVYLCQMQIGVAKAEDNNIVNTDSMKRDDPLRFGNKEFSMPELRYINQAAYWDYQREKVYIRSSKRLKRVSKSQKIIKGHIKTLPINKIVECLPTDRCPRCKTSKIRIKNRVVKVIYDLNFSQTGVKRWIVKYLFNQYFCRQCETTFSLPPAEWTGKRYGPNIIAYFVYQIIELRLPNQSVRHNLKELFGFNFRQSDIHREKSRSSHFYKETYDGILKKIVTGKLIHADETKVSIKGKGAYVWIFTSLEEVVYYFTETREGDFLQEILRDFSGVLVSDFYAAYDSINCPQQKCLIHLMRDLNDDLLKNPFNNELKRIVREFALLLKPMIETVDRFGLKTHFLRKHKIFVDRFYKDFSKREVQSEIAIYYKTRFEKNRNKLFTFLNYNGVPWNNNNAEHAVKAFAGIRDVIRGSSTENGIREYLTLLSICETCKYKGISFLNFLRSGEKDIDTFIKNGCSVTKRASYSK